MRTAGAWTLPHACPIGLSRARALSLSSCADRGLEPVVEPPSWGTVRFGDTTARVELATTARSRERGLMFRTELARDAGMLFIFREEKMQGFWMRNCYIPLSLAYIRADGRISQIVEMTPAFDEPAPRSYDSREPAKYVLEMEKSWFAKKGIQEGDRAAFSPEIESAIPE